MPSCSVFIPAEASGSLALCEVILNERLFHSTLQYWLNCVRVLVGFFPPSLLVKGVGQTQKRLLEMIVSREAALVLIEEEKEG